MCYGVENIYIQERHLTLLGRYNKDKDKDNKEMLTMKSIHWHWVMMCQIHHWHRVIRILTRFHHSVKTNWPYMLLSVNFSGREKLHFSILIILQEFLSRAIILLRRWLFSDELFAATGWSSTQIDEQKRVDRTGRYLIKTVLFLITSYLFLMTMNYCDEFFFVTNLTSYYYTAESNYYQ